MGMQLIARKEIFLLIFFLGGCLLSQAGPDPLVRFIENKNQWPQPVDFCAKVPGGNMFIQPGRFTYCLLDGLALNRMHERSHSHRNESDGTLHADEKINGHIVEVTFLGANEKAIPLPFGRVKTYYNYFIGDDRGKWASKAAAYQGILYPSYYSGIDMKIYSSGSNVKYDFIVTPGADHRQIKMMYKGADNLFLDNGNLFIETSVGNVIEKRPYAYQIIEGSRREVHCEYFLEENVMTFSFPDGYDSCYELVIDPILIFSTYSGSGADNWGSTATPGEHGNLYSAGVTNHFIPTNNGDVFSGTFPATSGAFQTSYGGLYDVAILKYDSAGSDLLYATYLGGSESESPHSLVMDSNEGLVVLGTTSSGDFPTSVNAYDRSFNGGSNVYHVVEYENGSDIFVARISKDGSRLIASTYMGGLSNDGLNPVSGVLTRNYGDELRGDVITDPDGNIYISTVTSSSNFPATNNFGPGGGPTDGVLIKFDSELTQLIYSIRIGGSGTDAAHTVKFDSVGNIFLAGGTNSPNFLTTPGVYQESLIGEEDGWIVRISKDGSSLMQSTYTGSASYDQIYFLDLNSAGEVYVYGQTTAPGSTLISPGVGYAVPNSGQFIQKFTNDLSSLIFSTVFGSGRGEPDISPTAFLVNECNNLYMAGWGGDTNEGYWNSNTIGLQVSDDAVQKISSGSDFYFLVLDDDASQFLYGTYLGGDKSKTHVDGGTSRFDKGGIVYHAVCSGCYADGSNSSDFPITPNAWSSTNNSLNCNNAAFKFDLASLRAELSTPTLKVCLPDKVVFHNESIGGKIFEWDFGDGVTLTRSDTSHIEHQYENPGTYTIKLKVTDLGTCRGTDETSIVIDVFEKQSSVQGDDAICEGTSYTLQANGGASYHWTSSDGLFASFANAPLVSPEDTMKYYLRLTEASGCVVLDTVQISVIPQIELQFDVVRDGECLARPGVRVINTTQDAEDAQMIFNFGDGSTSELSEDTHQYVADGTYRVSLTGIREFCAYEQLKDVFIYTLTIPNVITPAQEDGDNDSFIVRYGPVSEGKTPADYGLKVSLIIYNRWGKKIFETKDYQYNWSGDGLAAGIYYYDVEVEGHSPCRSWVHLVR